MTNPNLSCSGIVSSARRFLPGIVCGCSLMMGAFLVAQVADAQSPASPKPLVKRVSTAKKQQAKPTPAVVAPQPAPEPPKPDWPANDAPGKPSVKWDSSGLRIDAANSSLRQILNEVSTTTGAKVDGLGTDQRVFGVYGPGAARDVLSQLLQGSGYNVLMIGDQGQGTPREIVLSARSMTSPANAGAMRPQQDNNQDDDVEPDPEGQQPVFQPGMNRPPVNPPASPMGARTPQQMMQQRQFQQLQQLQQQMQNQQEQPGQIPNPPQ